jgi:hypothetical protein
MKNILTIIVTFMIANHAFSQNGENLKAATDSSILKFNWDIQKTEKGDLMFLDIPYSRDNQDSIEYLTLTVVKTKSKKRPDFISIIIPNNILQSNGIFIKFANSIIAKNEERTIEMEKGNPVRIDFEKCNNQDCTARIIDGYAINEDTNDRKDIFQKFLDFDFVLVLFVYPDNSHKSIIIPLSSFKKQYITL